jgi:hypothetical protein
VKRAGKIFDDKMFQAMRADPHGPVAHLSEAMAAQSQGLVLPLSQQGQETENRRKARETAETDARA